MNSGFGIGSHGLTHAPLVGRSEDELRRELVESREKLSEFLGRIVRAVSARRTASKGTPNT